MSSGFGNLKDIEGWVPARRKKKEESDVDSEEKEIKEEEDLFDTKKNEEDIKEEEEPFPPEFKDMQVFGSAARPWLARSLISSAMRP